MRNKSLIFSTLFVFAVTITALLFNSCSKEDSVQPQQVNIDDEFGKFTKEVTIYDAEKENSAVLLVGSNDESILNMWSSENFTLIPIMEGQKTSDVLSTYFSSDNTISDEQEADMEPDESDEVAASISTRFLSRNLKNGVASVVLYSVDPYDQDMRAWKYATHYSDYYGQAGQNYGTVTCNFYGQNFWHRGYYGLQYINYQGNGWSTIISEWKQIKKNVTDTYTRTPCYVMKARRKYKGNNNNSVLVEFQY